MGKYYDKVSATQAQQETGTTTDAPVTPSVQHYHNSAAKAWGRIVDSVTVGNTISTPVATGAYNVSSITDVGAGNYTVNFTTAFSSTSTYAYALTSEHDSGTDIWRAVQSGDTSLSASAFSINCMNNANGLTDPRYVAFVFFGDQ